MNFEHGKQSGPFKLFSDDGQLLEEGMLKNGLRHGPFTVYFPQTGKPARQGTYKMNEYDGELTTWRPDGMKVVQTYKNGVANGWQKNYNSQGALMGEIMMKNGRATGEFRAYGKLFKSPLRTAERNKNVRSAFSNIDNGACFSLKNSRILLLQHE